MVQNAKEVQTLSLITKNIKQDLPTITYVGTVLAMLVRRQEGEQQQHQQQETGAGNPPGSTSGCEESPSMPMTARASSMVGPEESEGTSHRFPQSLLSFLKTIPGNNTCPDCCLMQKLKKKVPVVWKKLLWGK